MAKMTQTAIMTWTLMCGAAFGAPQVPANWPQWRGPTGTGAAPDAEPPVHWAEGSNVLWRTALPGKGNSTPVIWNGTLLVTAAVETDRAATRAPDAEPPPDFMRATARKPERVCRFLVMAVDAGDGRVRWERQVCEEAPHAGTHQDGSWASASCIVDGERVFASFGSRGLYCLGMDGEIKWQKRFGLMKVRMNFGEGASPALHGDALIVVWDHEGPSFVAALDKRTGEEKWRRDRDEVTSWTTPAVVAAGGRVQVVTVAPKRIRSYNLATGEPLWECAGMTMNTIPVPIPFEGTVIATSGFRGAAMMAIRLDAASGDLAGNRDAVAWSRNRDTPYVPTPLLYGGRLYFLKGNDGAICCVDARTGSSLYEGRPLEGIKRVYASPVGGGGRVYVTGREGLTVVLREGPAFEVLASNKLNDEFTASAAIAGRQLFLRGRKALYCVGREGAGELPAERPVEPGAVSRPAARP